MTMTPVSRIAALCALLLLAATGSADDGARRTAAAPPAWQEECGSCHVAYPPRFLPAESWRRMLGSLEDHFGADASVEPEARAAIESFVLAGAGRPRAGEEAPRRITERRWFRSEHDDVPKDKWRSAEVGSPANCGACHRKADQGSFRERDIRIPRGEDA